MPPRKVVNPNTGKLIKLNGPTFKTLSKVQQNKLLETKNLKIDFVLKKKRLPDGMWSFSNNFLNGPDNFRLLMDFKKITTTSDSAVFVITNKLNITMVKKGEKIEILTKTFSRRSSTSESQLVMYQYLPYDSSFDVAIDQLKKFTKSIKVGSMVKIRGDLREKSRYEVAKLRGTKAEIYHGPSDIFDWVDIRDLKIVNITMEEYRAKVAKKYGGGEY